MAVVKTYSRWIAPMRSLSVGLGFFALGSVSDFWLQHHSPTRLIAIMTDVLLGLAAAFLVMFYEVRQQKNIMRKLEIVRLMNHHVRNSLQVIYYAASTPQQEELAADVRNAVERIEWALREVLPGQSEDLTGLLHPMPQDALRSGAKSSAAL